MPEAVPRDTALSGDPRLRTALAAFVRAEIIRPTDGLRRRRPNAPQTPPSARAAHAAKDREAPLRYAAPPPRPPVPTARPRRAHLIFPAAAAGARGRRGAGTPPGAAPLAAPGPAALPGQRGGGQPLRRPGHVAGSRPAALRVRERVWAGQSSRRRLPPRSHARRGRPAPRSLRRRSGPAGGCRETGAPEPAAAAAGEPRAESRPYCAVFVNGRNRVSSYYRRKRCCRSPHPARSLPTPSRLAVSRLCPAATFPRSPLLLPAPRPPVGAASPQVHSWELPRPSSPLFAPFHTTVNQEKDDAGSSTLSMIPPLYEIKVGRDLQGHPVQQSAHTTVSTRAWHNTAPNTTAVPRVFHP